jgi:glycosyltransferase involved in cell wall biosynthesis
VGDEVVIIVPVLRRPQNVRRVLASVRETAPKARVLFVADPDDEAEHQAIRDARAEMLIVQGNYAKKINCAVHQTTEALIFQGADDLRFHPGWLEAAKSRFTRGIGVVGTNDLCSKRVMAGLHSTHSLITREYAQLGTIDDPTRLLHEGYRHEFVDDEFVQTAIFRNAFAHSPDSIVEHLHPWVGKAPMDELYAKAGRRLLVGRLRYLWRRRLWH